MHPMAKIAKHNQCDSQSFVKLSEIKKVYKPEGCFHMPEILTRVPNFNS